ncbi:hypothetical protein [Colwellia psychrerythraea]|uniref:Uncharacterized protein n=1 Tax=Colwellia psychrerythraea TaxID=28229 RepID=A0A099KW73_COLPS|nr:hypothetical protein [Colwellia psychrerythraea]KGJ93903.1 hypothetical protein GAB14E_2458 [Colwellia psychrerythraea]
MSKYDDKYAKQACVLRMYVTAPQLPNHLELQGFEQEQCYIKGYLTNEELICEQLNIETGNQQSLLNAALKRWGVEVNKHLCGDYVLVWLNDEQLLVTSSARSSFTLYYQEHNGLVVATELSHLSQKRETRLNKAQLLQLLTLGPIAGKHTCFEHINQLQSGETLLWQLQQTLKLGSKEAFKQSYQAKLSHAEQLILVQDNNFPIAEPITPRVIDDIDLTELFNQLPLLAHRLGEPVIDIALAHFDSLVQASKTETLLLDESWLSARNIISEQCFHLRFSRCKSILKRPLLKQREQLTKLQQQLTTDFSAEHNEQCSVLSFSQWLDLHYVIPAWCQILQRICQHHGKTLINPYARPEQIMKLVRQTDNQPKAYFSLQQISLANVYDAMQRLFHLGEAKTLKLFNLNPAITARLIRQQTDPPQKVEQLSVILLTFDYLTRFHPAHLN